MTTHFRFGASSMSRILKCEGSLSVLENNPLPESEYAKDGSLFHKVVESFLTGAPAPEGETPQMRERALEINKLVDNIVLSLGDDDVTIDIEKQISRMVGDELVGGTPDILIYSDIVLHVIDIKNGWKFVDEVDNDQLMTYTLAHIYNVPTQPAEVYHHIYQPNAMGEPFRTSRMDWGNFAEFVDKVRKRIKLVTGPKHAPDYQPGEHCQFCNKAACPKLQGSMLSLRNEEGTLEVRPTPDIVKILEFKTQIMGIFKDAEAILLDRMVNQKEKVKGMKVVQAIGNRKWNSKAVDELSKIIPAHEMYEEPSLKSPAQVEKTLKQRWKGKDWIKEREEALACLATLVERPVNGPKIVKEDVDGIAWGSTEFAGEIPELTI